MLKVCEYVVAKINFNDDRPQELTISLPSGSKILRNNLHFSEPRKIFYLYDSSFSDLKNESHYLYLLRHSEKGVLLNKEVSCNDLIKSFEVNGKTWHLFELKNPLNKNGGR